MAGVRAPMSAPFRQGSRYICGSPFHLPSVVEEVAHLKEQETDHVLEPIAPEGIAIGSREKIMRSIIYLVGLVVVVLAVLSFVGLR
jgi:hypothetical protein